MEVDVDAESLSMEPPAPRPIVKLSEDVVNQIAAAEVSRASPPTDASDHSQTQQCDQGARRKLLRCWKYIYTRDSQGRWAQAASDTGQRVGNTGG